MMKEFRFQPASQMITVEEGQSLNIDITGIKTAYRCDARFSARVCTVLLKGFYCLWKRKCSRSKNRWERLSCSCYGAVLSLSGDAERDVAVEAVGQDECSLYSEDTVTDEEGRFRLRGLLVSICCPHENRAA